MSLEHRRALGAILITAWVLLLTPAAASAAGWTALFEPTRIWLHKDYALTDSGELIEGCTSTWIRIPKSQANYDEILTVLLLAKTNGHQVKIFVNGCHDVGDGVTQIAISPVGLIALED